ncbi:MAG: divalent-cation tolerance protein CutA [Alphaproteobacteria bacterium]|nr:divalent-cation tolerance protein CutA [Alphaproteobacteria bacterium]
MSEFILVYMLAASEGEAEKIAEALVAESLAACVNLFGGVRSIYKWQGKTERAQECAMIAKTTASNFEALRKRVVELHSYECPCIVALPVEAGHEPYLDWLRGSVAQA